MTPNDAALAVIIELRQRLADLEVAHESVVAKNAELHADIEVLQAQADDCLMVHE